MPNKHHKNHKKPRNHNYFNKKVWITKKTEIKMQFFRYSKYYIDKIPKN